MRRSKVSQKMAKTGEKPHQPMKGGKGKMFPAPKDKGKAGYPNPKEKGKTGYPNPKEKKRVK